ncbi:hypothetical protein [Sphingomonas sp. Mn802worker]|uniref:hypothetical protein n=1 Tax=Sphingomonas sp. Mn802worker TaxID=629773 RepID=UPI00035DE524|nr:hypothetical protein [Sphingomonas sp. Mn802worker]
MFTRVRPSSLTGSALLAPALLFGAAPMLVSAQLPPPPWAGSELAQLTIHERLIIRIPRVLPSRLRATPIAPVWHEKKGPRCVEMKSLTGAAISDDGDVDLIVDGVSRIRAKLDDDCPGMNFYSGFYLKPTADGKICAGRDLLRSRSGSRCGIDRFRRLVTAK